MNAEQIIRALAAADPVDASGRDFEAQACALCEVWIDNPYDEIPLADHKPDCPWRLAVEWVAEQG